VSSCLCVGCWFGFLKPDGGFFEVLLQLMKLFLVEKPFDGGYSLNKKLAVHVVDLV
jgi:hypothetical protein